MLITNAIRRFHTIVFYCDDCGADYTATQCLHWGDDQTCSICGSTRFNLPDPRCKRGITFAVFQNPTEMARKTAKMAIVDILLNGKVET